MSWPARFGSIAQRSTVNNKLYGAGYNHVGELDRGSSYIRLTPSKDILVATGSIWVSGSKSPTAYAAVINSSKRLFVVGGLRSGGNLSNFYKNVNRVGTGSNWVKCAMYSVNNIYAMDGTNRNIWMGSLGNYSQASAATTTLAKITTGSFKDFKVGFDQATFNPCTLALGNDNTLWGYGTNQYGELGDNTVTGRNSFVKIGTNTWTDFDIAYHSMAIRNDGTLWGWGYNLDGRVGDNTAVNRSSPVQVGTGTTWRQVTVGNGHTGAVKTDNTLWMWGYNAYGQLGHNNTTNRSSPIQVGTGTDWSAVMCGAANNTFAIKTDGSLWAWGANTIGLVDPTSGTIAMTGTGDYTNRSSPVQIATGSIWTKNVFASYTTQFAIDSNKNLQFWGTALYAGNGTNNLTASTSPVLIDSTNNFVKVRSFQNINVIYGYPSALAVALKSDGTIWNWGATLGISSANSLYSNYNNNRSSPVQIGTGSNWTSKFSLNTVRYSNDNEVACMFINNSGQLWRISSTIRRITTGSNWTDVTSFMNASNQPAGGYMCVQSNGTRWGYSPWNTAGELGTGTTAAAGTNGSPVRLDSSTNWNRVFAGPFTCYGIRTDGTLWSWGSNTYGQLGLNDTINRSSPVQIGTDTNWKEVFTGDLGNPGLGQVPTIFAIKTNGTLWGWGGNSIGQLGDRTTINKSSPVQIGTDTNWVSASAHVFRHSFGLKSNGTLWGWGAGGEPYQMRTTNVSSPVQIGLGLNTWKDVAVGTIATYIIGTT